MTITPDELVRREVIYCVSTLIQELAKTHGSDDEFLAILMQYDWETPAREAGLEYELTKENREYTTWQECCEANDIDPQTTEAFEHWIVNDWMANKLEAKGEMILRDFLGMTIWGRSCTGKMISMDSVIEAICNDLNSKAA